MDKTKKIVASVLVGSSIVGGSILSVVTPKEIPMTESKVYLMGEILQGRVPEYDLTKTKLGDISKDYRDIQVMVGDDIAGAVEFCKKNRKDKECNLYERIKTKLETNVIE
jgi:hypothetical protein